MSKLEFTPEDFSDACDVPEYEAKDCEGPQRAAKKANTKFEEWLKEQPTIYSDRFASKLGTKWIESDFFCKLFTHRAKLVCVEEI